MATVDRLVIRQIVDALKRMFDGPHWHGNILVCTRRNREDDLWAHTSSILGASVFQYSKSSPKVWRPYEGDEGGRDFARLMIECHCWLNFGPNETTIKGVTKPFPYRLAVTDPEKFLKFITQDDAKDLYEKIIYTLYEMSCKHPLKQTQWPITTSILMFDVMVPKSQASMQI